MAALGLVSALAAAAVVGLVQPRPAERAPDAAPKVTALAPPSEPTKVDRQAAAAPDPAVAREPYEIDPPYEVEDGVTFGPDNALKTRLAGLETVARNAICLDRDSLLWACGLQARVALNGLTRLKRVSCRPEGAPTDGVVPARCEAERRDLGAELIKLGFARPVGADPRLARLADEARRAGRGVWNGGWRIKP
ncbi:MAG: thermonuclease family protein [Methylobacteriaceae bacterium]|nr:thermonuclease family protein [Methylobacteriaceae bacterium]